LIDGIAIDLAAALLDRWEAIRSRLMARVGRAGTAATEAAARHG
jgi:hypothetical protein